MQALAEQLFFDGNRHLFAHEYGHAEACFREALTLAPRLGAAHANLAWLLEQNQADGEAEACYRRALALGACDVQIHLNYGAFLAARDRLREAEGIYVRAVGLEPGSAAAWSNLGALFAQMGRFEDAEGCCRMSMRLDPGYAKAHINLAYLCLRQGRFEEGWEHYERRTWQCALDAKIDAPRWAGQPLEGKTLLVGHEGGFGDMIHFCRYVAVLKQRGARRVVLLCPAPLERLFATLEGVDEVRAPEEALSRSGWDFWTSPMSAPFTSGPASIRSPRHCPICVPRQRPCGAGSKRCLAKACASAWPGTATLSSRTTALARFLRWLSWRRSPALPARASSACSRNASAKNRSPHATRCACSSRRATRVTSPTPPPSSPTSISSSASTRRWRIWPARWASLAGSCSPIT
jgi:hypothetical protein